MTRRRAPWHVRAAWESWNLATIAWEAAREEACNGWTTEQAEWEASNPRPLFREHLTEIYAAMRHNQELETAA